MLIASPLVPVLAGVLVPELRTAREDARLEIGSQRGRNSHQIGVSGIYDLQGLSYGRTELLVADMRLLAPDPSGSRVPWWAGAVWWALGAVLCWSPGARPFGSPIAAEVVSARLLEERGITQNGTQGGHRV